MRITAEFGGCLLLNILADNSRFVPLPVPVFFNFPLVMEFFPLRKTDTCFDQMTLPIKSGANTGLAFLCYRRIDLGQFFFIEKKFSSADGIGNDVR